jgi:quinol monooxygenase YgiN
MRRTVWTVKLKPGTMASTIEAGQTHIKASRAESGCLSFDFYVNADGSDTFVSIEQYVDEAAHLAQSSPHFRALSKVMEENFESVTNGLGVSRRM